MIVDELVARIGLEFNGAAAAAKAVASLDTFKAAALGVGGVLVGLQSAMVGLAVNVANTVDDYADFGDVVGASVETLQALTGAAESAGGDFGDVQRGLKTLVDTAGNAAKGNEAAAGAFAQLGVSVFGANGHVKNADQLIGDVADGLSRIPDPARQVNAAIDVLGKGAIKLLPALTGGRRGMEGFRAEMERIGVVMSKTSNERFKKLGDQLDGLKLRATGAKNILAQAFLPFAEEGIGRLTQFFEQNIGRLAEFGTRFGNLVVAPFQIFQKVIQGLPNDILALSGAAIALAAIFTSPAVAILALTVLIAAIAEDINNFLDGQESQLGVVIKEWKNFTFQIRDLGETADSTFGKLYRLGNFLGTLGKAVNPFADPVSDQEISNAYELLIQGGIKKLPSVTGTPPPTVPAATRRQNVTVNAPVNINGSNLSEAELRAAIEAGLTGAAEEISDMAGVRR